jgi:hypothetical protein
MHLNFKTQVLQVKELLVVHKPISKGHHYMISWRDEEMMLMVTKQLSRFKIKNVNEKECKDIFE